MALFLLLGRHGAFCVRARITFSSTLYFLCFLFLRLSFFFPSHAGRLASPSREAAVRNKTAAAVVSLLILYYVVLVIFFFFILLPVSTSFPFLLSLPLPNPLLLHARLAKQARRASSGKPTRRWHVCACVCCRLACRDARAEKGGAGRGQSAGPRPNCHGTVSVETRGVCLSLSVSCAELYSTAVLSGTRGIDHAR